MRSQTRLASVRVAQTLVAALPALIKQADSIGGPLKPAVHNMQKALAEAQGAVAAVRPGPISTAGQLLRRLADR